MILLLTLLLLIPVFLVLGVAVAFGLFVIWLIALIRAVFKASFVKRAGEG